MDPESLQEGQKRMKALFQKYAPFSECLSPIMRMCVSIYIHMYTHIYDCLPYVFLVDICIFEPNSLIQGSLLEVYGCSKFSKMIYPV